MNAAVLGAGSIQLVTQINRLAPESTYELDPQNFQRPSRALLVLPDAIPNAVHRASCPLSLHVARLFVHTHWTTCPTSPRHHACIRSPG